MDMCYSDLVSAAETETDVSSRKFFSLVNAAVSMLEEEERHKDRVFRLFPRKTRTCVHRRRRLVHGGAASTTPLLLDLNTVPADDSEPQNPRIENPQKPRFKRIRVILRNPNSSPSCCITDSTSRKRRGVEETKGSKKAKLTRIVDPLHTMGMGGYAIPLC